MEHIDVCSKNGLPVAEVAKGISQLATGLLFLSQMGG